MKDSQSPMLGAFLGPWGLRRSRGAAGRVSDGGGPDPGDQPAHPLQHGDNGGLGGRAQVVKARVEGVCCQGDQPCLRAMLVE